MHKKLHFHFLLFLLTNLSFSQTKITGKVMDSLGIIKNAHIININSKQGTFSNLKGEFEIPVSLGDEIEITSIQHKRQKLIIANIILKKKFLNVKMKFKTYVLDEIILKNHNLTGSLALDIKKTPRDTIQEMVDKIVNDIKNIDFSLPVIEKIDHIDSKVRPPLVIVDPIDKVQGLIFGTKISLQRNKKEKKIWSLEQEFNFKKNFPKKILSELGKDFFYKNLKIPEELFHNFIDYCYAKDIILLYKKNKILQLITVFKKESKSYISIIKKK